MNCLMQFLKSSYRVTLVGLLIYFIVNFCGCHSNPQLKSQISPIQKGLVIDIIDGDTYDLIMADKKTLRVRMNGIDAPEKGMPFYNVSKKYLAQLCFNKTIRLENVGVDNHGRTLAFSYLDDGKELSHEMVKAGLAWHFKKYSSDSLLSNLEREAINSKIGLWSDQNPMPPWENRRLHRSGVSTKDSFAVENK